MNYIELLKTIPFFNGLSDDELKYFVGKSQQRQYKKNQIIFHYGEPAEKFYIMLEGWIKLYRMNKDGEETVISLVTKGDTFSEAATFEGSDYPYSAQVVGGNAITLVLEAYAIREKVRQSPNIALKMLASITHHSNQLSLTYEHISKLTTAQRIGCFLLKLSMDRNYQKNLELPYNKYLVASRLGMKPETFSRAMKRLNDDLEISLKGREITIPDIDQLQEYCEVECFNDERCSLEKRLTCINKQCDIYRILKLM
ncbi:Crp/Fnr family transcriptional regulator [Rickettsiales bacterium]|nr:Crp/Fnr family transcriptional regulator [Rickettsiales bacterium]